MDIHGRSGNLGAVMVVEIKPGGYAQFLGLKKGDLVLKINGQKVAKVKTAKKFLSKRGLKRVRFLIGRGNRTILKNGPVPNG